MIYLIIGVSILFYSIMIGVTGYLIEEVLVDLDGFEDLDEGLLLLSLFWPVFWAFFVFIFPAFLVKETLEDLSLYLEKRKARKLEEKRQKERFKL